MPVYDLPLWSGDEAEFPAVGIKGASWTLKAIKVPYSKHGSKAWWRHFRAMRKRYPQYSVHTLHRAGDEPRIAPQIVAEAKSRLVAQKAFELVTTAISIIDGSILFAVDDGLVVPRDRSSLEDLSPEFVTAASDTTINRDNVIISSRLAAALSRRNFLTYSAFKLWLSYQTASAPWMSFHPKYFPKEFGVSRSLSDHVRMASAITLAYSAIEEMQLEPRPKNKKPIINRGIWDSIALADVQGRLRAAHVNLKDRVVWHVRGSQTRVHKSERAPSGSKLVWTKGKVRDKAVKIEDALIAASWLRSKCSTHRYQKQTASITMYDVSNVQNLARRLLLMKTGIWQQLLTV